MFPNVKSKQKVLLISYEYGRRVTGGIGRVVNGIFNSMPKDILFDIFVFKSPVQHVFESAYVYRKEGLNKAKCLYSGEYKKVFHTALKQEKYDVINITVGGPPVCWCIEEIKAYYPEVKIIFSCHSIAKHEIGIRNNNPQDLELEEYIMNNVDHIHVLNKTSLKYLMKSYSFTVENKQVSVIANGIDEADFAAIDDGFKNNILNQIDRAKDIVVLCLSRWSFGKGIEHLIDAIPKVIQHNKNVKFIIAGRKAQSWENNVGEYVQMVDEKIQSVSEYVIPLGWLDNSQRNAMFSIADICVMPSLLEYFPYGILEPMICKVPIISSNIDSVVELLEGDKECLFFTPENSNALAEKLIYLISNKCKREELSTAAYKKVKEKYNFESISRQYVSMYQSVV